MSTFDVNVRHVDLDDRKHPAHSGRFVHLDDLRVVAAQLRGEPDGLDQLTKLLEDQRAA